MTILCISFADTERLGVYKDWLATLSWDGILILCTFVLNFSVFLFKIGVIIQLSCDFMRAFPIWLNIIIFSEKNKQVLFYSSF